jgi:sigma-B regulation protein RsbU (phosphoserine phosphatase)
MSVFNNIENILHLSDNISADEHERAIKNKLIELQALFEISQILNSSLNLKSILDNMLLTPMGKMMISKGVILLHKDQDIFMIETLKGLPRALIGKQIQIDSSFLNPVFINEIDENTNPWVSFFKELTIEVVLPISSNKKNLGIIGFGKKIGGSEYTESELDFLNSLSNIAATSIENGLMFLELNGVNKKLDKKIQQLNTLFEIGKELNSTLEVDKILNLLLYAIMGEMVVNRCAILLKQDDCMKPVITKGIGDIEGDINSCISTETQKAFSTLDNPIILENLESNQYSALHAFHVINFRVLVPMRIQDENKGIIMIGSKIINQVFRADELDFLSTLGNAAMISIENARLFEETLEKQRLEEELNIANEIQQGLLPKELPRLDKFQLAAMNVPSRQVGGDYYDCIKIDETHYTIAIADVSGKGAPAALLMSNVQAGLHALIGSHLPIPDMIQKINNLIYENTSADKFITFFYGVLDIDNYTFTYCNAGHNPPYLYHADQSFELLETGGLLLGMIPNLPYQIDTVQLTAGDWLVLYTDGVNEATNIQEEEFDTWRLEKVIQANMAQSAVTMKNEILLAIKNFVNDVPQSDDITLITIKVA